MVFPEQTPGRDLQITFMAVTMGVNKQTRMDNSLLTNLCPCSHPNLAPSPLGLGSHGLCNGIAVHEEVQGLGRTAHHGGGQAVGEEVRPGALAEEFDEGFGASCVPTCRWRTQKWTRHCQAPC